MKFSTLATVPLLTALAAALVIPHEAKDMAAFTDAMTKGSTHSELFRETAAAAGEIAPLFVSPKAQENEHVLEDNYIIVFKKQVDPETASKHHEWIQEMHTQFMGVLAKRDGQSPLLSEGVLSGLRHTFDLGDAFRGYSGAFHSDVVDIIRQHKDVAFVEKDSRVFASEFDVENGAPWGLARVSHREALSLGSFNKYLYDDEGGEGVDAYVIDTGSNVDHEDLEGRARWGKTIPEGDEDRDGNGHGSHCSGTIAGKRYGVAKKANIVAVKVLRSNGSGSMSDVLKGVEYAAAQHKKNKGKKGYKGATANMSLGGGKSPSLDLVVNAAVSEGLHFAVAAGNDNTDACDYSPAAAERAVTVGATALSDDRAYFSNYGKCVDIFAPGVNILSIYTGSPTAVATLSGTSMASPHVCGLLAYYLSLQPSTDSEFASLGAITPEQLKKNLIAYGTKNIITDLDAESPNVLAFNGAGGNLTEFWSAGGSEQTKDQTETVKILPIDDAIKTNLDRVAHEVDTVLDSLKSAFGLLNV